MGPAIVKINFMGKAIYLIALLNSILCCGQKEYYQLVKEGERFEKPIVYLDERMFSKIIEVSENTIHFYVDSRIFIHDKHTNNCRSIPNQEYRNIDFVDIPELIQFEFNEFEEKAKLVEKRIGIKPVAPISHKILQVFVVREIGDKFFACEVDWDY